MLLNDFTNSFVVKKLRTHDGIQRTYCPLGKTTNTLYRNTSSKPVVARRSRRMLPSIKIELTNVVITMVSRIY